MNAVRFGILGPGNIARRFADAVSRVENACVACVASRDLGRARAFADKFGIARACEGYDALLRDPDVDAVYVATPHSEHKAWIERALRAGKAVLCEKPMCMNAADAARLVGLARAQNVLLMEAMWSRFLPTTEKALSWIAAGLIGEARLLQADFAFYGAYDPEWRLYNPALGGGAMWDVGVYCIAYAMYMLNAEPERAQGLAAFCATGADEACAMTLRFPGGALANLICGAQANTASDAYIAGTKGRIVMRSFWGGGPCERYDDSGTLIETFAPEIPNGFTFEVDHFARLFLSGAKDSPLMPLARSLACCKVFDAVRAGWR